MNVQDAVLHGLLNFGPEAWYRHGARLDAAMFDGDRRAIFEAIAHLNHDGKVADMVTVSDVLDEETAKQARQIAMTGFLSRHAMPSYITHLRRAHRIARARDIGAALAESGDIDSARGDLLALDAAEASETVSAMDANRQFVEELGRRHEGTVTGLKTGLADLDRLLIGLEPGDLCLVAARPSMGKTALMLNIALGCGEPVGIFSLEMSTAQLMTRLVAAHGVDYGRLRNPATLYDGDWPKITAATVLIGKSGLWINDHGGLKLGALESEAYRMVKACGVRLICVDYLQLVTCRAASRFEEVSEVSRRLKALAKNLQVPIIALSQLNRGLESRSKPIPRLSDLRESGQLEQDADQIVFIYRPEVYVESERPGQADLLVAKNRGGEIGTVTVGWQGHFQRFVDLAYPRAAA